MAIMESQNKKDAYTVIVLTNNIVKNIRNENVVESYFLRPTKTGSVIVSAYSLTNFDIQKHIKGLKAIDRKKAEKLLGVSNSLKNLTISILNNPSAVDSIADLKNNFNIL